MKKRILCAWEIERLQHSLDELLELLSSTRSSAEAAWSPLVDVIEHSDRFVVRVDLPGVERDTLTLGLCDTRLTIAGNKQLTMRRSGARRCLHMERGYGTFELDIPLPGPVSPSKSHATLRAGVLEIVLERIPDRRRTAHTIPLSCEEP
jgi:HSP20 family protein